MIEPPPVLEGEAVLLRPLCDDDVPALARWFADRELLDLIGETHPRDAFHDFVMMYRPAEPDRI